MAKCCKTKGVAIQFSWTVNSLKQCCKTHQYKQIVVVQFFQQKEKLFCFDLYGCFQWIFIQCGNDIKTTTRTHAHRAHGCCAEPKSLLLFCPCCCLLDAGAGCLQSWKEQKKPKKQSYCGIMLKSSNRISERLLCFIRIECELYVHSVNGLDTVEWTKPNEWHNSDRQQWEFAVRMAYNCGRIRFFAFHFARSLAISRNAKRGKRQPAVVVAKAAVVMDVVRQFATLWLMKKMFCANGNANLCSTSSDETNFAQCVHCTFSFCSFAHVILYHLIWSFRIKTNSRMFECSYFLITQQPHSQLDTSARLARMKWAKTLSMKIRIQSVLPSVSIYRVLPSFQVVEHILWRKVHVRCECFSMRTFSSVLKSMWSVKSANCILKVDYEMKMRQWKR